MENEQLIKEINNNLAIILPNDISLDELQIRLSGYINQLIEKDFKKLITILYRIDVSEPKLKRLLKQHPEEEAGNIIATLIIERQIQKINTRRRFKQEEDDFSEEEKW